MDHRNHRQWFKCHLNDSGHRRCRYRRSTITNTVTNVTLDQIDSDTTADDPSESVTVGNTTDLVVAKIVDNGTPDEGDTVTFTVTVTNNGPAQATNVSIDDVLPAGLTAGTITPSQGSWTAPTWTIGTLQTVPAPR